MPLWLADEVTLFHLIKLHCSSQLRSQSDEFAPGKTAILFSDEFLAVQTNNKIFSFRLSIVSFFPSHYVLRYMSARTQNKKLFRRVRKSFSKDHYTLAYPIKLKIRTPPRNFGVHCHALIVAIDWYRITYPSYQTHHDCVKRFVQKNNQQVMQMR